MYTPLKLALLQSGQTVFVALRALRRNKLRSGLTALGIIIGVTSVVAMVALGNGARARVESQVAALGQNLLTVVAGSRRSGGALAGLGSASTLTLMDADAIQREVLDVAALSPEVSTSAQAIANGRNWSTTIMGEAPQYLAIRNWKLAAGSMFTDRDVRAAAKVAVVGARVVHELFGPLDPLGQPLRIGNIPFVITGVLASKGAGMGGQDQDDRILVPYTTAMRRITGDKYVRAINVQVANAERMSSTQQQIASLLRQRHRLGGTREDDFTMFNQKDIADAANTVAGIITLLLGAIASISLVVGGIGIMNIMLVSVTERTREIGIRVAVGAQPEAIHLQFLVEALILSVLGGLLGVALGVGLSRLIALLVDFEPIISVESILLALGVSFATGLFFGLYPATKAAALNPIEALRYE